MSQPIREEQRENWGSRAGFVLAAVGSAVGLGNLWGFPYKVYANGGGAFLVPYVIAMLLIGIPLLILELSMGHMTQRAAPDAYRSLNRRSEPIGWWGILLGFVIITYYPVILAWCGNYLVYSIQGIFSGGALPWAGQGMEGVQRAGAFFESSYLNTWSSGEIEAGAKAWSFGGLVRPITISLVVMWIAMYLCIFRGVRLVSKVVLWTVPLPWIMLLILTVRGLTLPGAAEGLNFYLDPEWSLLARPQTWRWAFGQMFFSMSLAFGVMITYASFLHRKSDINNNAAIIGLADVGTSFVAGIAVFATLGAMAMVSRDTVAINEVVNEGPGLAFVVFPYALAQLPHSAWFAAVFFTALLTLGIDSAFSITESVLASIVDKTGWSRGKTLIGMSLLGLGAGLVYCTRGGVTWIGTIDEFINGPLGGIAMMGLLECVVVGWSFRIGRLREHANERSEWRLGIWWDWIIRYLAPVILSALLVWSLFDTVSSGGLIRGADGRLFVPGLVGACIALLVPIVSLVLSLVPSPGAGDSIGSGGADAMALRPGIVVLGGLLAALSLVALIAGFRLGLDASIRGDSTATGMIFAAAILALAAVILGARAVNRAERVHEHPAGLARAAAGWGVMVLGGCGGLFLALRMAATPIAETASVPAGEHLSGMSAVVLGVMMTLLVAGLGWCFYRALRGAAGLPDAEQAPEGDDSTSSF